MSQREFDFNAPPRKRADEVPQEQLAKIKKLLRLSESTNPHEAALAMRRAMDLANRHNLDLASLELDEEVAHIVHRWFPVGSRLTREHQLALGIVGSYFHVEPCLSRARGAVVFVGTEMDVMVAAYVFEFLCRQSRLCLRSWQVYEKFHGRRVTCNKTANFIAGFFYGISSQLHKQRETLFMEDRKFAIVLSDQQKKRESVLSDLIGEMKALPGRKPRRNRTAIMCGFLAGENTRINPALPSGEGRLALR
jgi:hypothetical protein